MSVGSSDVNNSSESFEGPHISVLRNCDVEPLLQVVASRRVASLCLNAAGTSCVLMHICELTSTTQRAHSRRQLSLCLHTRDPFSKQATKWRTDKILAAARRYGDRARLICILQRRPGLRYNVLRLNEIQEHFNMSNAFLLYFTVVFRGRETWCLVPRENIDESV
jgi:hypothetical protein